MTVDTQRKTETVFAMVRFLESVLRRHILQMVQSFSMCCHCLTYCLEHDLLRVT
jgi:hypothetical protein